MKAEEPDIYIRLEGNRLFVSGPVTYDTVVSVTRTGIAVMDRHDMVIDLSKITDVDSSAVSMLLEWARAAQEQGRQIAFTSLPANLTSLVELYDVGELIPVDRPIVSG